MAASARYFDLVREMKNAYNHRLRLVESVRERGIKPTARLFATSTLTVRKWWRRYQQHGPSGLREHSRAPHGHTANLAGTRLAEKTAEEISAQARPRAHQGYLGTIPTNQRGYQGSRRYPLLLAAGATVRSASHPVHGSRST